MGRAQIFALVVLILLVAGVAVVYFYPVDKPDAPPKKTGPQFNIRIPGTSPLRPWEYVEAATGGSSTAASPNGADSLGIGVSDTDVRAPWDWTALRKDAGATGELFIVELDTDGGLKAGKTPAMRLVIGTREQAQIYPLIPGVEPMFTHETTSLPPKGEPLPTVILNPYALLARLRRQFPKAVVLSFRLETRTVVRVVGPDGDSEVRLKTPRAMFEVELDRSEGTQDFAVMYFDAVTGMDVTAGVTSGTATLK